MEFVKLILRWLVGVVTACLITLALFLILPLMQAIGEKDEDEFVAQDAPVIQEEVPPDVEEEEEPPEDPEDPPEPPEIPDEPLVADISQLDLALGGPGGVPIPGADMKINLDSVLDKGDDLGDAFDVQLDQPARVIYQSQPNITPKLARLTPATVVVIFVVSKDGRVDNAVVQSSSNPAFNQSALSAVKQWRFEPGQSKGKPVESRMRIPITFPKQ